jgi:hypothetical protein
VAINQLDAKLEDSTQVKFEVLLGWGKNCEKKSLWIYVPETEGTFELLNSLLTIKSAQIQKLDVQARSGVRGPCIPGSKSEGYIPFSNVVYAYHASALSEPHAVALIAAYAKQNLALSLRGQDYFEQRRASWSEEDSSRAAANSPHVVYFPGEL